MRPVVLALLVASGASAAERKLPGEPVPQPLPAPAPPAASSLPDPGTAASLSGRDAGFPRPERSALLPALPAAQVSHDPASGARPATLLRAASEAASPTLERAANIPSGSAAAAHAAGTELEDAVLGLRRVASGSDAPPLVLRSGGDAATGPVSRVRLRPARRRSPALREALLRDFERNFKLGQDWSPSVPVTRTNAALADTLARKAAALNAAHRSAQEHLLALIGGLGHDIKNPAGAIGMAASLLTRAIAPGQQRLLDIIGRGVANLASLSDTYTTLSQLDSGRLSLSPERIDVGDVLGKLALQFEAPARARGLNLVILQRETAGLAVDADRRVLAIALDNLIGNALKYTPKGGTVIVGAEVDPASPGRASISVSDTGPGISAEDQALILAGAHHRTAEGRKAAAGSGIGLPLVMRVLAASGTSLAIRSRPGSGSRFSFELPLAP